MPPIKVIISIIVFIFMLGVLEYEKESPWKLIGIYPGELHNVFTNSDSGEIGYGEVYENSVTGARKWGEGGYILYPFKNEQILLDMGFTLEQVRSADGKHFMRLNK